VNAHEFVEALRDAIVVYDESEGFADDACLRGAVTFDEAGVLTRDAGLVVQFADGTEFQVTVVRSSRARDEEDDG
jgi:hypothetical protein